MSAKRQRPTVPTAPCLTALPPALLRHVLRFIGYRQRVHTACALRRVHRDFAHTFQRAPLDFSFTYIPDAALTASQAQRWVRSATHVLETLVLGYSSGHTPGVLFPCLRNFTTLRNLTLVSNCGREFETTRTTLPSMTMLTCLKVSACKYFLDGSLAKQPSLQQLHLDDCPRFRGAAFAPLPNLTYLSVSDCHQFTGTHLASLTCLDRLIVSDCSRFTFTAVAADSLPNLASLDIVEGMVDMADITDDDMVSLSGLPRLQRLMMDCSDQRRGSTLATLTSLTSLQLRMCYTMSVHSLANLRLLTCLRSLQVNDCPQLRNDVLARWTELTNLTSLVMFDIGRVTDEGIAELHRLPRLQHLGILRCRQLRGTGLLVLTNLTCLEIGGCPRVTEDCMAAFHLPKLCARWGQFTRRYATQEADQEEVIPW